MIFPSFDYDYTRNGFSYKIGGTYAYYLNNRISVRCGVIYESNSFKDDFPPRDPNDFGREWVTYKFTYVGIPLIFAYDLVKKDSHKIAIRSGLELNRLLKAEIVQKYSNGAILTGLDNFVYYEYVSQFSIGIEYSYHLSQKFSIGASPYISYCYTPYRVGTAVTPPLSLLCQISLGYWFNR